MSKKKFAGVALKLLVAGTILVALSFGCGGGGVEVTTVKVSPQPIEKTVSTIGAAQAYKPAQVIPKVFGTVEQVFVEEGQHVVVGQPLAKLETSSLEQSLLSAEAGLETVNSIYSMFEGLQASATSMGESVRMALENVNSATLAMLELSKAIIPTLPEEQRTLATEAIERAYEQYTKASSNPPTISSPSIGKPDTSAQEASSKKAIEIARGNLEATTIRATGTGVVTKAEGGGLSLESMMGSFMGGFSGILSGGLDLSALTGAASSLSGMGLPSSGPIVPGSLVVPGSPIFNIVDLRNMTFVANVTETDVIEIKPYQRASINFEAYPSRTFGGAVISVADTTTTDASGATTYKVTIKLDPTDIDLKIGMNGSVRIVVATKQGALAVPADAVIEKKGKKFVFVVEDGKAKLTPVEVGIINEETIEIASGIRAGDRVISKGIDKLEDGQPVKIMNK
ncbi:MAG: efflux RND transporter periplasmic adaptor subunit [Actinomycetota bacterium]|nr:efflux RND transporter periplasmic adaptor subunit [Actinomycetota bacterium]